MPGVGARLGGRDHTVRDLIGEREKLWNGGKRSPGEVLIKPADNYRSWGGNDLFNNCRQVRAEELRLFNGDGIWIDALNFQANGLRIWSDNAWEASSRAANHLAWGYTGIARRGD